MFGWLRKIFKRSSDKVKDIVVPVSEPVTPGEEALRRWGIDYIRQKDGTLLVPDNLNVSNKDLTELPDLSNVVVDGNFSCLHNRLTSLKGAPRMFKALMSDFGVFWHGEIPEELRHPPRASKPAPGSFDF